MSILGYSSSYFLPEYWSNTPLYGEKIIPLIDYILSTDFPDSDKLAGAFYNIVNKYKNTPLLPLDKINAIIDESGYSYVRDLLGNNEESIRLLVSLLVLIHQLKGSKIGIQVVLNLLRKSGSVLVLNAVGGIKISSNSIATGFSTKDYIAYNNFTTSTDPFEINVTFKTSTFGEEQCLVSSLNHAIRLSISPEGKLLLSLGNNGYSWNIVENALSTYTLSENTTYYVVISYSGYSYEVRISTDNKKFSSCILVEENNSLNINGSTLYLGVDKTNGTPIHPFKGSIDLGPFGVSVENIGIEEWFETLPVGIEDTFIVKAELDITLVSSGFFQKFADFVKKYVYPSLTAFEAKLVFQSNLTFLPYIREVIDYTGLYDNIQYDAFYTYKEDYSGHIPFFVTKESEENSANETYIPYLVLQEILDL